MALPKIPKNLKNLPFLREFLKDFRREIFLELESISGGGGGGGDGGLGLGTGALEHAATVIVDQSGFGDATTIADGIALLPAAGGSIYIEEGTYSISSPIVLPAKHIKIQGAGNSTILDIGNNVIALFEIADPNKTYVLEDFDAHAGNVSGQSFIKFTSVTIALLDNFVFVNRVRGTLAGSRFHNLVEVVSTGAGPVRLTDSRFINERNPIPHETPGNIWTGSGVTGFITIDRSLVSGSSPSVLHIDAHGSTIGVTTAFFAQNCTLVDCTISVQHSFGMRLSSTNRITGCRFVGTTGALNQLLSLETADHNIIEGCDFEPGISGITRGVTVNSASDELAMSGCRFGGFLVGEIVISFVSESLRTEGTRGAYSGNQGFIVTEAGSADRNVYSGNEGFTGSTIIGPDSVVNGHKRASVSAGATTASFVNQFVHSDDSGMTGIGTVKNTGANDMEVRENVTDAFGVSASVITTVSAGNDYLLDPQTNFSTVRPPHVSYGVDVRHPGSATTFDLEYGGRGVE